MKNTNNQRRDSVLKRMLNTPPEPHKPLGKKKSQKAKPKKQTATKKPGQ